MTDLTRLKEVILYVADKSEYDNKFGAVKLNKILYYADFRAYRELGHSITGATYQHLPEGPAPKELLLARQELVDEGALEMEYRPVFNFVQHRLVALRSPNIEVFSSPLKDKEILDETIEHLAPYWGYEVSEMSHREWGYRLTQDGEEIPYRTAWLDSEAGTQEQLETVQAFLEEKGYAP